MHFTELIQDRRARTALKILLPGLVAAAIVYHVKFAPAAVTPHEVTGLVAIAFAADPLHAFIGAAVDRYS